MPVANPFIARGMGPGIPVGSAPSMMDTEPIPGQSPSVVGTGSLTAPHNAPLHCAFFVIVALIIIFGARALGFRFAIDAGLGK